MAKLCRSLVKERVGTVEIGKVGIEAIFNDCSPSSSLREQRYKKQWQASDIVSVLPSWPVTMRELRLSALRSLRGRLNFVVAFKQTVEITWNFAAQFSIVVR